MTGNRDRLDTTRKTYGLYAARKLYKGAQMSDQGWTDKRPMSPHLQVWKFHPTMLSSILHRATGVANYLGAILVVGWLFAAASGEAAYATYDAFFSCVLGQLILFGFTVSIMYHLSNGIRHLFWDAGKGFSPKLADFWAWFSIAFSLIGSIAIWLLAGLAPFAS